MGVNFCINGIARVLCASAPNFIHGEPDAQKVFHRGFVAIGQVFGVWKWAQLTLNPAYLSS